MKVFKEEQRFTQIWLHLVLIISFGIPMIFVINEWILTKGDDNDVSVKFYIIIGSILMTYGIIFSLKLKTRIDEIGIQYRFIPFHFSNKIIAWSEIDNANIRKYNAISEFGGWGLKGDSFWNKGKGVAYNVKGNIGLQLKLKNGKKVLIGTQKRNEVEKVLLTYKHKIIDNED